MTQFRQGAGSPGASKVTGRAAKGGLSPRTVELVQKSWASVMPISDAAATLFYDRLFEIDPTVRPMFKNDMREQKKKLMQTLAVAVDGLSNPDKLVPVLQQLGIRHAGYMVTDRHYDLVGQSLLWTLKEGLGDAFTRDVETAWTEVYTLIADVMKKAAADHAAQRAPEAPSPLANLVFPSPKPAAVKPAAGASRSAGLRGSLPRSIVVPTPKVAQHDLPPDSTPLAGRTLQGFAAPDDEDGSVLEVRIPSPKAPPTPSAGLSPRTVELVQKSWASVMPISDAAATLFYDRLFEIDPTIRPMFKNDMREQKKKLMQTLAVAVDGLSNPPKLIPVLQQLGVRHAGYMVTERHYDLVGESLLWTLKEGLGNAFTREVEAAWTEVYTLIADVMKKAAADAATTRAPELDEPPPELASMPLDEDAATLHYEAGPPSSVRMPMKTDAPPAPPLAKAAPEPAAAAPVAQPGVVVPVGRDGVLNVVVKLETPAPSAATRPAARAEEAEAELPARALGPAMLLALLCMVASMAGAAAVLLGADRNLGTPAGTLPGLVLGAPIASLVVALTSFSLGYMWARSRGGMVGKKT